VERNKVKVIADLFMERMRQGDLVDHRLRYDTCQWRWSR